MKKRLFVAGLVGVAVFGVLFVVSFFVFKAPVTPRSPDSQRLSDLAAVKSSLGFYVAKTGNPFPSVSGATPKERWREVEVAILSMEAPAISAIPWDPKNKGEFYYDYGVSPDGDQFVLRAKMSSERYSEGGSSSRYVNDIDGKRFGIDCGDPEYDTVYCVGVILEGE